jgi:hypothetical protein
MANMKNVKRLEDMSDGEYLRDLSGRLMHIPVMHGVDQYDAERTYNMAKSVQKITAHKRRAIQIAAAQSIESGGILLYALCDDGTMWVRVGGGPWERTPEIPT